jgi:vancomycin resistance protein YoaR
MNASKENVPAAAGPQGKMAVVGKTVVRAASVFLAAIITTAVLAYVSAALYDAGYSDRVFPGISVYGMDLSGLPFDQAAFRMSEGFSYPRDGRITITYEGKTWTATPGDLGLGLDLPATVTDAYAVGRSGDGFGNLSRQLEARFSGVAVAPVLQFDFGRAMAYLQRIAAEVDRPPVEARLERQGLEVAAIPGQMGKRVNTLAMLQLIAVPIGHLVNADIPLQVTDVSPEVLDASSQAETARQLLAQDFLLSVGDAMPGDQGPWTISPAMLADMLSFRRVSEATGARYALALDEGKLAALIQPLSASLSRQVKNARYQFDDANGGISLYIPSQRGRELNVSKSIESVQAAVAQGAHGANLGFDFVEPEVGDNMTADQLNITGLLLHGLQWTSFKGSAAGRINNIVLASEQFNGVLVKPGETFSFGAYLGEVSFDTGYSEALIIQGNRTIKGVGGGVCQVSTTIFRVALMTGFPIAERWSHAYRVSYYENGDGPIHLGAGFDATVSLPAVDFKFTNDSPYWLLMETEVDKVNGRLNWRFYSKSDDRTVEVNRVGPMNVSEPLEPKWEPNPELTEDWKQVDWDAEGSDYVIYRTITYTDRVVHDQFSTRYKPWGAVCQYNPDKYEAPPEGSPCPPE